VVNLTLKPLYSPREVLGIHRAGWWKTPTAGLIMTKFQKILISCAEWKCANRNKIFSSADIKTPEIWSSHCTELSQPKETRNTQNFGG
jgi:hypothetical protein